MEQKVGDGLACNVKGQPANVTALRRGSPQEICHHSTCMLPPGALRNLSEGRPELADMGASGPNCVLEL
jgi:hypothetical protein